MMDLINSYVGLPVTIIGFMITFWGLYQNRVALHKTIREISDRLLSHESKTSTRIFSELRDSTRSKNWHKAIDRCDQLKPILISLLNHPSIPEREKAELSALIDDVSLIVKYIEKEQSKGRNDFELKPSSTNSLNKMEKLLHSIDSRTRNNFMEILDGKR